MDKLETYWQRAKVVFGSRKFFWAIMILFGLEAAWIALSGRYPMAFDEDFHLGIIKLYAHHLSPFWSSQPENADMFGAVARDPSYLYQYLMSFPYRLISLFTHDQTIMVIILRFINIGFFASGLALFRKLLFKSGVSRAIIQLSLLIFVLLPVVPLLAAQINYDNLLLPLVALALLLTLRLDKHLIKHKFDAKAALQLLIVCLATSLVKYAFLPIFLAIVGFIAVRTWQNKVPLISLTTTWRALSRRLQLALVVGLVVSGGLFAQRIGYNLVRYHTLVPDCSKVISLESCREYGPWIRNYNLEIAKVPGSTSPLTYTKDWFYGMWLRTYFTVGGANTNFQSRGPLVLPAISAIVLAVIGLGAFLIKARTLFRRPQRAVLWLLLVTSLSYVGFLWFDEFQAYAETGQPVAINGRYILPVLLPMLLLMISALAELTKKRQRLQLILASLAILCMAWGGGALTFILRSNDSWYWNSGAVRASNHALQRVIGPITPGNANPALFLQ